MSSIGTGAARTTCARRIGRARGLGSAKSGTGHFWVAARHRRGAALLVPWLVGLLVSLVGADTAHAYARDRQALERDPAWRRSSSRCSGTPSSGIQVVIEDYVHTRATEITLQLLNILACTVGALASLYAIGRIALMA